MQLQMPQQLDKWVGARRVGRQFSFGLGLIGNQEPKSKDDIIDNTPQKGLLNHLSVVL